MRTAPSLLLAIGAGFWRGAVQVIGLDFTQLIDIETRATLSRAFAERHVLVMRNLKAVHVAWRTRKRWRSSTS